MSKNQHSRTFRSTKKLNLDPRFSSLANGLPAVALAEAGTKLSFQFAVPVRRTHSQFRGVPASSGVCKLAQIANRSTSFQKKLRQYLSAIIDWKQSGWRGPCAKEKI